MKKLDNDEGFSIVELLIAIVILGLVGVALLNAVSSSDSLANKNTEKQIAFNYLTAASEFIAKEPFVTCNQNTALDLNSVGNPYQSSAIELSEISPVKIVAVEGFDPVESKWYECGPSWPAQVSPSIIQRITIRNDEAKGTEQSIRVLFKNLTRNLNAESVQVNDSGSVCSTVQDKSFDILSGTRTTLFLAACDTNNARIMDPIQFFSLPGSGLDSIGTTCTIESDSNFSIAISGSTITLCPGQEFLPSISSSAKSVIEIGAINVSTAKYYEPITIGINVFYPPTLCNFDDEICTAGIRTINTVQGSNRFTTYANEKCDGTNDSQSCSAMILGLKGGFPNPRPTFNNPANCNGCVTSAITMSVNNSPNFGTMTLVSPTPPPSQYAIRVDVAGGGIPEGQIRTQTFNLKVFPKLAFASDNPNQILHSSCNVASTSTTTKGTTITTTTFNCPITLRTSPNTGIGTNSAETWFLPNINPPTGVSAIGSSWQWNSADKHWVYSATIRYQQVSSGTNSVFCSTQTTPKNATFSLVDSFYTESAIPTFLVSVPCS